MINSIIHQPCEVSLHLYSSDIFVHPPRPNADLPGDDKTLQGLVEIRVPSERTIQGVKVTLQGHQTISIPERSEWTSTITTRYEDKVLLEKTVEITSDVVNSAKGKGKAKESVSSTISAVDTTTPGIQLDKGVHGFEFAFIIPASSAPFERGRYGRVRYLLTATAIGAGRGRSNVVTQREIFIILHVNADGGPVPLDIQYHDVHEALGAMSISLTSASLSVGGAATLSVYHPSPPPGLSVHVLRVFLEQTIELYSETRGGWMKLPAEKLRLWERGYMPHKEAAKQIDPNLDDEDGLWLRADSSDGDHGMPMHGHPGRAVIAGGFEAPTLAPYGRTMHPGTGGATTGSYQPGTSGSYQPSPVHSLPGTPGGTLSDGYRLKTVLRLPDDNVIRPSTVRGSRAEIRISHELGVEVFFSRAGVLDERPQSETFGKPKVQVFSMRRATIIPSCCATYDAIHLPPYSLESPMSSRPPSPGGGVGNGRGRAVPGGGVPRTDASQSELDHWKLTQTLRAALGGHANASGSAVASGVHSAERSQPGSATQSRNSSPTRQHSGPLGYFQSHHGRRSRPPSPTPGSGGSAQSPAALASVAATTGSSSSTARRSGPASHLHALTPTHKPINSLHHHNNTFPTVITAPASGSTTPKSLPANSPWALGNFPVRSCTSHDQCQCGRSTEELMEAEHRLLEGAPTAPGVWIDAHDEGQLPPPWTPSRPSSPVLDGQDVSGWYRGADGIREGGRPRGKIGEMNTPASVNGGGTPEERSAMSVPPAAADHDSDDDGGHF